MRIATSPWSRSLAAALALSGCSKFSSGAAPEDPLGRAPLPALAPEAVREATLSYLEAVAPERCQWVQHTPPGEPRALLVLPTACPRVRLAWSLDGREALLHFTTRRAEEPEATHHLWRVELATPRRTELPLPPVGELARQGFDSQGRLLALTADALYLDGDGRPRSARAGTAPPVNLVWEGKGAQKRQAVLFAGRRYPLADVGVAGLAHAFRLEHGQWRRIETASTFYDVDQALGVYALQTLADLGPTPEDMEDDALGAFEAIAGRQPVLAQLPGSVVSAAEPDGEEPFWHERKTPHGALYANLAEQSEARTLTAPVYQHQGRKGPVRLPLPGIEEGHPITVFTRGELLLVVEEHGAQAHARLWNLKTQQPVASVEGKHRLTFWPQPVSEPAAGPASPPASELTSAP